jgi:transcriptional regulator with XRE-family HTH domain/DNA-binding Xre family transcriptional regulator
MPYGLDFSDVRFETDYEGNRLTATIKYSMFSALVEYWIGTRRAHTAWIEANAKPGQIRGSMQAAFIPSDQPHSFSETRANPSTPYQLFPNDPQWQKLIARMPDVADLSEPEQPPALDQASTHEQVSKAEQASTAAEIEQPASTVRGAKGGVFFREFMAKPPAEVAKMIKEGVYFLRAWREHRQLTLEDAAELFGRTAATIKTHETGRWPPSQPTLEKFAQAYDVPLLQLVPLPGSDTTPFVSKRSREKAEALEKHEREQTPNAKASMGQKFWKEPVAPADTVYPDAVLAHLKAGKSPMLAWRLFRRITLADLAEQYGGRAGNVKAMEDAHFLRPPTIAKLCPIFRCKPEQLLRPAGVRGDDMSSVIEQPAPAAPTPLKAVDTSTVPLSPMEAAFMRAESAEPTTRDLRTTDRVHASTSARTQR